MKEWDIDAYIRKWKGTHGFYTLGKEKHQGSFIDFFGIDRKNWGVLIEPTKGQAFKAAIEADVPDYFNVTIEYQPIESGWYLHKSGVALLTRKHVRGFQVGMSTNNHSVVAYDGKGKQMDSVAGKFHLCDFLNRPKFVQYTPGAPFGIMTERLWWQNDKLMFLRRCIGMWKTPEAVVLEQKELIPFVQPHLGGACQISY